MKPTNWDKHWGWHASALPAEKSRLNPWGPGCQRRPQLFAPQGQSLRLVLASLEDSILSRHDSLRGPFTAVTFPAGLNGPSNEATTR
jgi:hypothetical protein